MKMEYNLIKTFKKKEFLEIKNTTAEIKKTGAWKMKLRQSSRNHRNKMNF